MAQHEDSRENAGCAPKMAAKPPKIVPASHILLLSASTFHQLILGKGRGKLRSRRFGTVSIMSLLKAEPAGPVRSLDELFAIAHAMESDAVARYTETAAQLRQQGAGELASVFDGLADIERGHVQQVTDWAEHREAAEPSKTQLPWTIPDTFDAPPGEMAQSKLLTPYRALASAVRHEERSFAFWTYVAAHADRTDVKEAAERMALEELEHVSLLRSERRKAFHAEREALISPVEPVALRSLAPFERCLAEFVEQAPALAAGAEFAPAIVADARRAADVLDRIAPSDSPVLQLPGIPPQAEEDPIAISEYLAEAYLRFAEASTSPDMLTMTQGLAATALYRLATLRSVSCTTQDC
jgi:rubrerythrin